MTEGLSKGTIRAKVICIFRDSTRILVIESFDPIKQELFYCPPGGGIEFGELSVEALRREIREELNTEIENPRLMGVLENLFTFDEMQGHEIVFVHDAQLANKPLYALDHLTGLESNGETFNAIWLDLETIGPHTPAVYPDGLLELINKDLNDPF